MKSVSRRLGWALLVPALLLTPDRGSAGAPERIATWQAAHCTVGLEVDRDDRVLRLRPRCPLSSQDAEGALLAALAKLRDLGDSPRRYRSLFLGRLVDYPWISEGLALWAARSPAWNAETGRPRNEADPNAFVSRAMHEAGTLEPLARPLAREGIQLQGVSAEKVLIATVAELAFADRLESEGVPGAARIPYDAMVHLSLRPDEGTGARER